MASTLVLLQCKSVILSPGCIFESWGELLKNTNARATPDQLELILGRGGALGSWSFLEGCEMLIS